jgi:hypothetical protein
VAFSTSKTTATIAHVQYNIDSSSKLGAVDWIDTPPFVSTGTNGQAVGNSMKEDTQIIPFSYTVPDGKIAIAQALHISTSTLATYEDTNANGDYNRQAGTYFISIAGSTVSEEGLWMKIRVVSGGTSSQLNDGSGSGGPMSTPKANRVVPFGDGIQLTSGQVFAITYSPVSTPNSAIFPHSVHAFFHAKDSVTGAVITQKVDYFPTSTTASQTVLTYTTGSNGITIQNWFVWAEGSPPIIFESIELYLNDAKIGELPYTVWTIFKSKPQTIVFPLWGVTLGPRQVLQIKTRPWVALGQLINVVLYGEVKPVGYPRSRVR